MAAPISGLRPKECPMASSWAPGRSRRCRCRARVRVRSWPRCAGWRAARRSPAASVMPRSIRLTSDLQHGGDDRRAAGRAEREERLAVLSSTIVGDIDERGRLPARAGSGRAGRVGRGEGEVGQLVVEQEAAAGHDDAGPPVCSMVSVYATTLPHLSATVRWRGVLGLVRRRCRRSPAASQRRVGRRGSPAATGLVSDRVVRVDQAGPLGGVLSRQQVLVGTSTKAGSPT